MQSDPHCVCLILSPEAREALCHQRPELAGAFDDKNAILVAKLLMPAKNPARGPFPVEEASRRGFGDHLAWLLCRLRIARLMHWLFPRGCGCNRRQAALNQFFWRWKIPGGPRH